MNRDRVERIKNNPRLLFLTLGHRGFFNWMSDEKYLRIAFKICMGRELELAEPKAYSDKLQWLKLYDRKTTYTNMVDKYEVKKIVAEKIGEQYVIPTLGVWNHFDDINFDILPEQFVIKCTHDSGGLVICKDKKKLNKRAAKKKIQGCLKHNFFWGQREWPYKNVVPRIIAEPYLEDSATHEMRDYKFFTFDGNVKAFYIATERNREEETKFDFFDSDDNLLPFMNGHPHADQTPKLPTQLNKMKFLATELGKGIPQVRVDFYEVDGKVFFGEFTFFHMSGMAPFNPEEWDYRFGTWIELPR